MIDFFESPLGLVHYHLYCWTVKGDDPDDWPDSSKRKCILKLSFVCQILISQEEKQWQLFFELLAMIV